MNNMTIAKQSTSKKPMLIALTVALLAISVAIYWGLSTKNISLAANTANIHAAENTSVLNRDAKNSHRDAASAATQKIFCAPDDQACDTRSQASRTIAYRNMRDRHAERD